MSSKALRVMAVAGVYVAAVCGLVAFEVYAGGLGDWFALVHFGSAVPLWVACSWALAGEGAEDRSQRSVALIAHGAWGAALAGAVFILGMVVGVNFNFAIGGVPL